MHRSVKLLHLILRTYLDQGDLENECRPQFDVVWPGGDNVYYLRWLSRESGFNEIIKRLVARGIIYGGDNSAGAIIVGPTVDYFQSADEPELILKVPTRLLGN